MGLVKSSPGDRLTLCVFVQLYGITGLDMKNLLYVNQELLTINYALEMKITSDTEHPDENWGMKILKTCGSTHKL